MQFFLLAKVNESGKSHFDRPFGTATTEQRKQRNRDKPKHENQRDRKTFSPPFDKATANL